MEVTEPLLAKTLYKLKVNVWDCESNNGGRGFGRSVERILNDKYHTNRTVVNLFYQSKNKTARILGNSTWVMAHVYMPQNWRDKFPEFYKAIYEYQKEGKNKHDDAADALTGLAEKVGRGAIFSWD